MYTEKFAVELLLQQTGVTSHALPPAQIEDPGIGKAAHMIVGLALKRALRMVSAGHDGGIAEEVHLHILNRSGCRFELWVFDVGQKSLFVADFAIVFRVHEAARNQRVQSRGIAVDLRFIPQTFQDEQLAFAPIRLLSKEPNRCDGENKAEANGAKLALEHHDRAVASSRSEADIAKT